MSSKNTPSVAVVGATGLVGRTMLQVLHELDFPIGELRLLASARSEGMVLRFRDSNYQVQALGPESFKGVDIALFSAGGDISREYAPIAAAAGAVVVDNSSAWRMHPEAPLVIPEVNAAAIDEHRGIIANPNCSTIQMLVALAPLDKAFGLTHVSVSTYQSPSGAGEKGVQQLHDELARKAGGKSPFPHRVAFNTVFHDIEEQDGYSMEELKMIAETHKILARPDLPVTATCVRVPVLGGHGEAIQVEFERPVDPQQARSILENAPGIVVQDRPQDDVYPTCLNADGKNEVFVGRIRRDNSRTNGLHLWVVADNVRKGAATNAVQIAAELVQRGLPAFSPPSRW